MRIVCEKCASAYLIDDRVITPRGVRAQCPKCRNLQLVKRAESTSPPPEPGAQDMTNAPTQPYRTAELAAMLERAGTPSLTTTQEVPRVIAPTLAETSARKSPPGMIPTGSQANVRRGGAAAPPPPPTRSDEYTDPGFVAREPLPTIAPMGADAEVAAADGRAPEPEEEWVAAPLRSPFADPAPTAEDFGFLPPPRALPPEPELEPKPELELEPAARLPEAPPVAVDPPPGLAARDPDDAEPTIPLAREDDRDTSSSRPTVQIGQLRGLQQASPPASRADVRNSVKVTVVKGRRSSGRGLQVGIALGLVTVVAGVAIYFSTRGNPKKRSASAEYAAVLARWKTAYPEVTATENELVTQGEAKISEDRTASYAAAELLFEQAMVKNPASDVAMAGYVEAVALGRGRNRTLDESLYQQTLALGRLAVDRSDRQSGALVALGNLLLARPSLSGNRDQARALAEEALKQPGGLFASDAHLLLGRSYLPLAAQVALPHLDQALVLDENFRRGYDVRSQAHALLGQYPRAISDLERRLTLDSEHGDALRQMGALYEDVGETAKARKLYEKLRERKSEGVNATLALAILRYQAEGKPAEGAAMLRGLLKPPAKDRDAGKLDERTALEAEIHLAAAERLAGNFAAAEAAAGAALALDRDEPAAHFQLLLLALDQNLPRNAREHLAFVQDHLDDPALEATLAGRVLYADHNYAGAGEAFERALKLDSRRIDAGLWSGVTAYALGQPAGAAAALTRVLAGDPTSAGPRPTSTRFFMRSADLVKGAEAELARLAKTRNDVTGTLLEGVARLQLRQLDAADKLFAHAEEIDPRNGAAWAYRTLIALEHGDLPQARAAADKAVAMNRDLAIAHYARGCVLAAAKDDEGARAELREAATAAPSMVAPELMLAELEAPSNVPAARARLVKVVAADPSNSVAKRHLFLLDKGSP